MINDGSFSAQPAGATAQLPPILTPRCPGINRLYAPAYCMDFGAALLSAPRRRILMLLIDVKAREIAFLPPFLLNKINGKFHHSGYISDRVVTLLQINRHRRRRNHKTHIRVKSGMCLIFRRHTVLKSRKHCQIIFIEYRFIL